jgi:hypothetical protein
MKFPLKSTNIETSIKSELTELSTSKPTNSRKRLKSSPPHPSTSKSPTSVNHGSTVDVPGCKFRFLCTKTPPTCVYGNRV